MPAFTNSGLLINQEVGLLTGSYGFEAAIAAHRRGLIAPPIKPTVRSFWAAVKSEYQMTVRFRHSTRLSGTFDYPVRPDHRDEALMRAILCIRIGEKTLCDECAVGNGKDKVPDFCINALKWHAVAYRRQLR